MMFSLARRKTTQQQPPAQMHFAYRQIPIYVVNKPIPTVQQQDNLPKMKWGRPIWTFST